LFHNILDIFSKFHENILELFGIKVEIPENTTSRIQSMNGIQSEASRIQTSNDQSSRIIERFSKIINNQPEEVPEKIIQEENTPLYKNKYVIIDGLLILSGLT
jgi:hypothetical protein